MFKRILAITAIFIFASVAWAVLGGTIFQRTYNTDFVTGKDVESLWGVEQDQYPATASFTTKVSRKEDTYEAGKKITKTVEEKVTTPLPLEASTIKVNLDLDHRQKGLLWYSTYKVDFSGVYSFRNTSDQEQTVDFELQFPTTEAIYDDLTLTVDGAPAALKDGGNAAATSVKVAAGKTTQFGVGYKSQGLDFWRYSFRVEGVAQVRDFTLQMHTNFRDIEFPEKSISPTDKRQTRDGWDLTWSYKNLLSGYQIAMEMPQKLQPGPLAGKISFFAPVSLFFFFFLMLIITTIRGIDLHPMNYFFLAAAFFSFHLLLAYLVDHISIHASFGIASVVSVFLVVSYLRLVVGIRFASREAALAQFIYLVMFSYAFFLKGFTGLAITIGSVLTLFVVMQVTGRIKWAEKFGTRPAPAEPSIAS